MRALVVGFGSIGQRHARILAELGCSVAVVCRRSIGFPDVFGDLREALESWRPDYVVIASRTFEHHADLSALAEAGYRGRVLVEKPLFHAALPVASHSFSKVGVGYNLRFHPLLSRLREITRGLGTVAAGQIYVGQHLSQWRPSRDYRSSYSSRLDQGGGVLRDLSHEIDYALWLFGGWSRLTAHGGHLSRLEIDSDDSFTVLLQTEGCRSLSISMNYLDRKATRWILAHTGEQSVHADLVAGVVEFEGKAETFSVDRDFTYRAQHQAMMQDGPTSLCGIPEGIAVLRTIEAAERASRAREWVTQ